MKKQFTTALFALFLTGHLFSQNPPAGGSMLDMLGDDSETQYAVNAFKGIRVINGASMEMLAPGTMDFRILHRFGWVYRDNPFQSTKQNLHDAFVSFYGLDQASMRMSFDFGITKNFQAGIGRSVNYKEVDASLKYRLLWQSKGKRVMPVSVVALAGATRKGEPGLADSLRYAYWGQLLIGRKFNENFSLQLAPIFLHQAEVSVEGFPKDLFTTAIGARYKITKRMAIVAEYGLEFRDNFNSLNKNPLAIGLDIETGGHVFQLHFSNSEGMNERSYLGDENTRWEKAEVRFGFNLSRIFQLKKQDIGYKG